MDATAAAAPDQPSGFADLDAVVARAMVAWRPPPKLSLSQWADRNFVLSAETAAEPGRWHTLPYQREILDSMTDPSVVQVTWMKSARVGYTLCISAAMGYYMDQDPTTIMVVEPTVDDAKAFSKETVAPMLRDVPVLSRLMVRDVEERAKRKGARKGGGPKDSSDTLTLKKFPGGILDLVGANSGTGFRRKSRRIVMFDEVDAYPPSAGSEGDQIELGMKRAEAFHNRKIIAGSTPLIAGASRIEELFLEGDQRRYYVPCPQCGHMDFLTFSEGPRGHYMHWPEDRPEEACFVCRGNGCVIEHKHKRWMIERGEWRADKPGGTHRSYHIWSAYSYSPNASWGQIAQRFIKAKRGGPEKLKTFVNTELGETWKERGEAPDWERLYQRRENYPIGTVPGGVVVLTSGVDVQKDRLMYEVVGWTADKESFSIEAGILLGDTSLESTWTQLDALLDRDFPGADGTDYRISMLAVDSGYNTQTVYNWARRYPMSRVIACKGASGKSQLVGSPSPVEITVSGRRLKRGYKVWPIGVDLGKSELYGWLGLKLDGGEVPPGYCHFPEYGEDYFKQLTAEHLVSVVNRKTNRKRMEWHVIPNRENHYLDARILARVAAAVLGIDRMGRKRRQPVAAQTTAVAVPPTPAPQAAAPAQSPPPPARPQQPPPRPRSGFLAGGRGRGGWLGGGGWLKPRY